MDITLFKTRSGKKVVSKVLTDAINVSVTLKGSYTVEEPTFILTRGEHQYFNGYNYLYCPDLGMYYFAEITLLQGGLASIKCVVDPLMTHKVEIYGLSCLVERQENIYNPYFSDPLVPIAQGTIIDAEVVGSVLPVGGSRTMYLTCIGGVETPTE